MVVWLEMSVEFQVKSELEKKFSVYA